MCRAIESKGMEVGIVIGIEETDVPLCIVRMCLR